MDRFCKLTLVFICIWPLLSSLSQAFAQEYPVFEGFLGASALSSDWGKERHIMPGLQLDLSLNARRALRLTAEFAAHYRRTDIQSDLSNENVRLAEYQFLGGPELVFRGPRKATPFLHMLFGIAARHYYTPSGDPQSPRNVLAVDFGFASALGGGVDIAVSRRWALRVGQFDYLLTHLAHDQPQFSPIEDQLPAIGAWQHNFRFSAGVVVRLGAQNR